MKVKIVQVHYVDPEGKPTAEVFDCSKCVLLTEHGFLKFKFHNVGITRMLPFHRVLLVDYGETDDSPLIVPPGLTT